MEIKLVYMFFLLLCILALGTHAQGNLDARSVVYNIRKQMVEKVRVEAPPTMFRASSNARSKKILKEKIRSKMSDVKTV